MATVWSWALQGVTGMVQGLTAAHGFPDTKACQGAGLPPVLWQGLLLLHRPPPPALGFLRQALQALTSLPGASRPMGAMHAEPAWAARPYPSPLSMCKRGSWLQPCCYRLCVQVDACHQLQPLHVAGAMALPELKAVPFG